MPYWADSGYLIGLLDPKDPWHADANTVHAKLSSKNTLHIHPLAIAEVTNRIAKTVGVASAEAAYTMIRDDLETHFPDAQDLDDAMDLVVRYDGDLSLSDALFVHLMGSKDIVLSFDQGFDGKVRRLPSP